MQRNSESRRGSVTRSTITTGSGASASEFTAWRNSLSALANQLRYSGVRDHGVVLEMQLQLSSARLDAFVFGHSHAERESSVLVELKQWTTATPSDFDGCVRSTRRRPGRARTRDRARLNGEGVGARMMAGFCWPWSDPNADGTLIDDVTIGDFRRPWNAKPDARKLAPGIPPAQFWATDPGGEHQVGCIYTAQGFEFAHAGRHLGPGPRHSQRHVGRPAIDVARPRRKNAQRGALHRCREECISRAADARHAGLDDLHSRCRNTSVRLRAN